MVTKRHLLMKQCSKNNSQNNKKITAKEKIKTKFLDIVEVKRVPQARCVNEPISNIEEKKL